MLKAISAVQNVPTYIDNDAPVSHEKQKKKAKNISEKKKRKTERETEIVHVESYEWMLSAL